MEEKLVGRETTIAEVDCVTEIGKKTMKTGKNLI